MIKEIQSSDLAVVSMTAAERIELGQAVVLDGEDRVKAFRALHLGKPYIREMDRAMVGTRDVTVDARPKLR